MEEVALCDQDVVNRRWQGRGFDPVEVRLAELRTVFADATDIAGFLLGTVRVFGLGLLTLPWAEQQRRQAELVRRLRGVVEAYPLADRTIIWPVAMVRAVKPRTPGGDRVPIGSGISVSTTTWKVYRDERIVAEIPPAAGRILHLLATMGEPLTAAAIASQLHGLGTQTIYNSIALLNTHLGAWIRIHNRRRFGYTLERADPPHLIT